MCISEYELKAYYEICSTNRNGMGEAGCGRGVGRMSGPAGVGPTG